MSVARVPPSFADLRPLTDSGPWRQLDVVAETGSTNADLIARAAAEYVDGHVIVADHQTAGDVVHLRAA